MKKKATLVSCSWHVGSGWCNYDPTGSCHYGIMANDACICSYSDGSTCEVYSYDHYVKWPSNCTPSTTMSDCEKELPYGNYVRGSCSRTYFGRSCPSEK